MKRHLRRAHERFSTFWWGERGLSMILVLLIACLLLMPFMAWLEGRIVAAIFLSLLLFTGITQISTRRLPRILAALLALAAVTLIWFREAMPENQLLLVASLVGTVLFLAMLTIVIIGHTFQDGPITANRIQGALAAYLLIGLTWASLYRLVCHFLPGAIQLPPVLPGASPTHRESDLTYFSFVTLTTLGYGDILPIHPTARMLAILESLIGQLFPATLLARLVSLQLLDRDPRN